MAEALVFLHAQNIDDDNGVVDRVCQACGIYDDDGGVGTEKIIHNVY